MNGLNLKFGFIACGIGILITILLGISINVVIRGLTDVLEIATLPVYGGVGFIVISMFLTVIAGFFLSKIVANIDPVETLRTK